MTKKSFIQAFCIMFMGFAFADESIQRPQAQIQVHTMDELESFFADADAKTLAIFDVDMVLVQPEDPVFQMQNMKRFSPIAKRIMGEIPTDKQMIFLALMTISSKTILIDKDMPKFFQKLRDRFIPTMALTANLTGKFLTIESMEKWRSATLRELGIDFSKICPCKEQFVFTELACFRNQYSTYIDGMLFVNGKNVTKGDALTAFLDKAKLSPSKIIFVDDREENLKSVEEAAYKLGIEFRGIHYLGAQKYPSKPVTEEQFQSQWTSLAQAALK
jgi:hypothetical protein